jgi:hypothetical protein
MLVDSFKAFITSGRQHSISFKVGHSQQFHLMAAHLKSLEHHSAIRKSWPNRKITIITIYIIIPSGYVKIAIENDHL